MDTYLIMMYVSLDQEKAIKSFCLKNGWPFCKPDLCVLTDKVGVPRTPDSILGINPELTQPTKVLHKDNFVTGDNGKIIEEEMNKVNDEKKNKAKTVGRSEKIKRRNEKCTTTSRMSTRASKKEVKINTFDEGNIENHSNEGTEAETSVVSSSFTEYKAAGVKEEDGSDLMDKLAEDQEMMSENEEHVTDDADSSVSKSEEIDLPKVFNCSYCDSAFKQCRNLKYHMRVKHNITKEHKVYPCKNCNETFTSLVKCQSHLRMIHKEAVLPSRNYICEICGQTFERSDYLKVHRDGVHLGIRRKSIATKNIICEICGVKFKRKCHLDEHKGRKHGVKNVPYHACTLCPKKYDRPGKLEYHIKKVHEKSKTYNCTACYRNFYTKQTLDRHKRLCAMNEDAMFACEKCGKKFKTAHNLKLHMQAAHSKPALECACGQVIRWQSSVAKHKRRCPFINDHINHLENMTESLKGEDITDITGLKHESRDEETSIDISKEESRDISKSANDCIDALGNMKTELDASVSQIISASTERNISGLAELEGGTEISSERKESDVHEEIFLDLVNDVGQQVLEVSSTLQATNSQQTNSNSNVIYVIMKK